MNKTKQKIVATLCAFGCTFSGNTKNIRAESLAGVILPFIGIFITAFLSYRFSTRNQRQIDKERMNDIAGSDFDFSSIDYDVARDQMQEVAEMYPYAKKECEIIMDFICGVIKTKQEDPKAQIPVLSLDGVPGCGKTSMLKRLLAAIGVVPIIISPTDVDNGNKKISPLQQAYGSWTSRFGNYFMQVDAPLTKALKVNKYYTCVIFDDADKFAPEVIQGFWNIADGGKIKSGDSYIDTSKLFTFVTSNKSINKLADKMLSDKQLGIDSEWVKAVKTRFMCLNIPAPRFIDYRNKLVDLLGEFASLYEDINIVASDEVVDSVATFFLSNEKCMRNMNELRIYLNGALSKFRSEKIKNVELKLWNNLIVLVEFSEEPKKILKGNNSVENKLSNSSTKSNNSLSESISSVSTKSDSNLDKSNGSSLINSINNSLNNDIYLDSILDPRKRINVEDDGNLVDPIKG